ncbi:fibronectin type III domain-containing protein [Arcobacter venerupis]|uniref:Fibronectin type III domain-containing protein n=1 Tax=Arcobacter venerupis TaxID=1054033 RepID=A0AAE7BAN4_9BACT|nr:fibronectin type III domain-containing protein [Arcobacter venerupis]QKF66887.1 fibronectin type III domain-containing protein [Arcobacter venerupis]RWS49880.1 hypothetical protein CKA56_07270 [Arcobacter venerupis]
MLNLMKITSLATLILLLNGCTNVIDTLNPATNPKVDASIEVVNYNSIKSIPDMANIGFEWEKVNDSRVIGYNFYRTEIDKGSKELKLIKSIDNKYATHYVDKGLEPKTRYAYQISSRIDGGIESKTTDAYIVQTLPRIVPIDFVQAISNLPHSVKLLWKPHPDKRVGYYRIEKYNTFLNEWILLKTISQRLQAEYLDTGLDNNTSYKYRIKAFSFDDVESAPSKIVIAKTKPLPQVPLNIKASNNQNKEIILTWDASPTADVVKYAIYRSDFSLLGYSKIKEVDTNTHQFTDKTENSGKSYYYKVIAVDKDGLESDTTSVQGISFNNLSNPSTNVALIEQNNTDSKSQKIKL